MISDQTDITYAVDPPLRSVLDTLPEDSAVPAGLVIFGLLIGQLTAQDGDTQKHLDAAVKNIEDVPTATLSPDTVDGVKWLLHHLGPSLDERRKNHIRQLIATAGLFATASHELASSDDDHHTQTADTSAESAETTHASAEDTSVDEDSSDDITWVSPEELMNDEKSPDESANSGRATTIADGNARETTRPGVTEDRSSGSSYECEFCGQQILTEEAVISHAGDCEERPAGSRFECGGCGKVYSSDQALSRHKRTCDRDSSAVTDTSEQYQCPNCREAFESRHQMTRHRRDCRAQSCNRHTSEAVEIRGNRDAVGALINFDRKKGFGFISIESSAASDESSRSDDVFVHISNCTGGRPSKGDRLHFDIEHTDDGLEAVNVLVESRDRPEVDSGDDGFASERTQWGQNT